MKRFKQIVCCLLDTYIHMSLASSIFSIIFVLYSDQLDSVRLSNDWSLKILISTKRSIQ